MASIRTRELIRKLNDFTPGSPFARALESSPLPRLDHRALKAEVSRYQSDFERGEQRVLDGVLPVLAATPDSLASADDLRALARRADPLGTARTGNRFRLTGEEAEWIHDFVRKGRPAGKPWLSPDGLTLFQLHDDGYVRGYARDTGEQQWEVELGGPSGMREAPAMSADGKSLLVVNQKSLSGAGKLWRVDLERQELSWEQPLPAGAKLSGPFLSADGKVRVTEEGSSVLRTFEAATGQEAPALTLSAPVTQYTPPMLVSPDGKTLYLFEKAGAQTTVTLRAVDASTGEARWQFEMEALYHHARGLSPDGKTIYLGTNPPRALDARTGQLKWTGEKWTGILDRDHFTQELVESPDGKWLALPGNEALDLCDPSTGAVRRRIFPEDREASFTSASFTADGLAVVAHATDGSFLRVELASGGVTPLGPAKGPSDYAPYSNNFSIAPGERWAYVSDWDRSWAIELEPRERST
jgi:hypothetical protein